MSLVVATHNLMRGLRLSALIDGYRRLRDERGLDVLCVQENESVHAAAIAAALGARYAALCHAECGALAIVYDRETIECVDHDLVPLPRLERLSWLERRYIRGGKPSPKLTQLATLRARSGAVFALANFHLDTAGGNAHRARQVEAIAAALRSRGGDVLACGDTNAFAWRDQLTALREMLAPLRALGADDPGTAPTHFFARAREPMLPHRIGVALGRLGLDRPGRYDVVCTSLSVTARGQLPTPASDHDLVWIQLAG